MGGLQKAGGGAVLVEGEKRRTASTDNGRASFSCKRGLLSRRQMPTYHRLGIRHDYIQASRIGVEPGGGPGLCVAPVPVAGTPAAPPPERASRCAGVGGMAAGDHHTSVRTLSCIRTVQMDRPGPKQSLGVLASWPGAWNYELTRIGPSSASRACSWHSAGLVPFRFEAKNIPPFCLVSLSAATIRLRPRANTT